MLDFKLGTGGAKMYKIRHYSRSHHAYTLGGERDQSQ